MASKKVVDNVRHGIGLLCENSGYIASAFWDLGGWEDGGEFVLNFHREGMPAFKSNRYFSLDSLELAMREFQPDLRKWKCARV